MLAKNPETISPDLKPNGGMGAIHSTWPVGAVFTVAILLIFLTGIHPARWLLVGSAVLGIATTLIVRIARRG